MLDTTSGTRPATLGGSRCPVCAAVVRPTMDLEYYTLFACTACGCWCSDALVRQAVTSFVPESYFQNTDADRRTWEQLLDQLARERPPIGSALDVGCGNGAFLTFLAGRNPGIRISGIELDAERAVAARARCPSARVLQGDVLTATRELNDQFDLITLWDVFEHLPEPGVALSALARHLTPSGTIFMQTIFEESAVPALGRLSYRLTGGRLRAAARRTHEAHHLVFFTRRGLDLLAAQAGLTIRALWWDRLALARMDGPALLTVPTALLLRVENLVGRGLFVSLLLSRATQ